MLKETIWVADTTAHDGYFNRCVVYGMNTLLGGNYFPSVMAFLDQARNQFYKFSKD